MSSSFRALKGIRVLAGAQGYLGALAAQFKALEEVAHALAEAVVAEPAALDLVHEPAAERRGIPADLFAEFAGRVLVEVEARVEQPHEFAHGLAGRRRIRAARRSVPGRSGTIRRAILPACGRFSAT